MQNIHTGESLIPNRYVLKISEIADLLGVSETTVRSKFRKHEWPGFKCGGVYRMRGEDLISLTAPNQHKEYDRDRKTP